MLKYSLYTTTVTLFRGNRTIRCGVKAENKNAFSNMASVRHVEF